MNLAFDINYVRVWHLNDHWK